MGYFDHLTLDERDALLTQCALSTEVYSKTFFGDTAVKRPFTPLHLKALEAIDSPIRKTVIGGPRGLGKSTIGEMVCCRHITFRLSPYICYVSKSHKIAMQRTESIKKALLTNPIIRSEIGSIKPNSQAAHQEGFSKESWVAQFPNTGPDEGIMVMPVGMKGQIRGQLYNYRRPHTIIIDDFENKDLISNEDLREEWWDFLLTDVLGCVDQNDPYKIIYIDTLKHSQSCLAKLFKATDWEVVRLPVCDEEFRALAPDFLSQAKIDELVQSYREKNKMSLFYQEWMVSPRATDDMNFTEDMFRRYYESDKVDGYYPHENPNLRTAILVDPAKTVKKKGKTHEPNKTAIVVAGIDTENEKLYFRDCRVGFFRPSETYDHICQLGLRYKADVVGVEVTSLHEFIVQPLKNEMKRQGLFCPIEELHALDSKEKRVEKSGIIENYYARGQVYHNAAVMGYLEPHLLEFPENDEWDVIDAWTYVISLMEKGLEYFQFKGTSQDPKVIEAEMDELDYEPALSGFNDDQWERDPLVGMYG